MYWIWLGVGWCVLGWAVFNAGTWAFHAYLNRAPLAARPALPSPSSIVSLTIEPDLNSGPDLGPDPDPSPKC